MLSANTRYTCFPETESDEEGGGEMLSLDSEEGEVPGKKPKTIKFDSHQYKLFSELCITGSPGGSILARSFLTDINFST